jgi:hypothetical protein
MPRIDQVTRDYVDSSERVIDAYQKQIMDLKIENVTLRIKLERMSSLIDRHFGGFKNGSVDNISV